MNTAFLKSFETLRSVYSDRAFSSIALNRTLAFCKNQDKALITKIVYGVLDNDIKLDYILSKYVRKMPKGDTLLYLKIGAYCLSELAIPSYAVVNDVAELSKTSGDKYVVGFVNATLKNLAKSVKDFDGYPTEFAEFLSVKYSYPLWAVKKLIKDYGADTASNIVSYVPANRQSTRFDKSVDCSVIEQKYGCKAQITPFNDAFYTEGHLDGQSDEYTFQSLSSMAIARICAEKLNGGAFLDCCSAPGGKAVYVKQLCPDSSVTACDVHAHRVDLINAYASRMRVDIKTERLDMTSNVPQFDSRFDVVLCDVPCSGFGALDNHPDIKIFRESKDISELKKLQYAILSNCSNYVKIGGHLIYSTCTLFDNENGQNARKFLQEHPNFKYGVIRLKEFPNADNKPFYQFLPHVDGTQGFYVCVLMRTE